MNDSDETVTTFWMSVRFPWAVVWHRQGRSLQYLAPATRVPKPKLIAIVEDTDLCLHTWNLGLKLVHL